MDGKLLILCDEKPKTYEHYKVRDRGYLVSPMRLPEDDEDRLFVAWDAIIPEDRFFIEACKHYARTFEKPAPDFAISQRGCVDTEFGNVKGSIQEESFFNAYTNMIDYLGKLKSKSKDDNEWYGEAMELGVQYPFDAMQRFYEDFSRLMRDNGVVKIMPCFSRNSEPTITAYRRQVLDAWQNANKFMKENASSAEVIEPMEYDNMGEVYSKSIHHMMEIMSMPYFFEEKDADGSQDEKEIEFC